MECKEVSDCGGCGVFSQAICVNQGCACTRPPATKNSNYSKMSCSPVVAAFAYISIAYLGASILYLIIVWAMGFGTPFRDSLSEEQKCIMKKSKRNRSASFAVGIVITAALLAVFRPLRM